MEIWELGELGGLGLGKGDGLGWIGGLGDEAGVGYLGEFLEGLGR